MTNPDNAVGTNGAYGGRTSVNAFNDIANFLSRGIVSGWSCVPYSGMTVTVGGSSGIRDVALAEDNSGNKTTINNISGSPIAVTIAAASASSQRIDCIVAYVEQSPQGSATVLDNPSACGLIAVEGTSSSPPDESAIRAAITADGGSGSTAYYVVLAQVTIAASTTDIDSTMISQLNYYCTLNPSRIIPSGSLTASMIASGAIGSSQLASNSVTAAKIASGAVDTSELASGAVTSDKIDFTSFVAPFASIQNTVLQAIECPTSSSSYTTTANYSGFLCGEVVWNGDVSAGCAVAVNGVKVAGWDYVDSRNYNQQMHFCVPVAKGDRLTFTYSAGKNIFESVRLFAAKVITA